MLAAGSSSPVSSEQELWRRSRGERSGVRLGRRTEVRSGGSPPRTTLKVLASRGSRCAWSGGSTCASATALVHSVSHSASTASLPQSSTTVLVCCGGMSRLSERRISTPCAQSGSVEARRHMTLRRSNRPLRKRIVSSVKY
eukprot:scaffold84286_cov63-Phaeocystis_antarctica.AAC.3